MNELLDSSSARYGSGAALEITQIERELQRLWKDAAESSTKSGGGPVVRACSMTLVAPCTNDIQFDHVAQVVEQAAFRQPCRAILVKVDLDNKNAEMDASVSTVCALGGPQQKRVCHEQIQLFASAGSLTTVAPSVLALLVPDVPAYIWTPCEKLLATPIVQELASSADALLLDSHRFTDPFRALDRAQSVARDHRANRAIEGSRAPADAGSGFGVLDLEWIRLQTFFDATAAAFERPAARAIVNDIQSLRIEYTVHAAADKTLQLREWITPALFAGWFASRLGWEMEGHHAKITGGALEMRFERNGARRISLVPRKNNDRSGAILSIEIASTTRRIKIERPAGEEMGNISITDGARPPEATTQIRFVFFDDVEALSRALARAPRDLAFEAAIPIAASFAVR